MSDTPTVICFDWGGVILRIAASFEEGCRLADVELREKPASAELLERRRDLVRQHQTGSITPEEYYRNTSEAFEGVWSPEEIRAISDAWLIAEYEGVGDLLRDLAACDAATCLLSNTSPHHYDRGGQGSEFPAIGALDHRFVSHEIGALKPDEAAFRHVEEQLGAKGPQIAFFDDTAENVTAAQELGWQAFRIDPLGDPAQQLRVLLHQLGVVTMDKPSTDPSFTA